jgi:chaperonin cofactor prefoldin
MDELHRDYTPSNELIDFLNARVKALEIENEKLKIELDKLKSLIVH